MKTALSYLYGAFTLCTLTSVCIFSILFSVHFFRFVKGLTGRICFNDRDLLLWVVIILVILMFDSGMIL